jgi:hypothetical protein
MWKARPTRPAVGITGAQRGFWSRRKDVLTWGRKIKDKREAERPKKGKEAGAGKVVGAGAGQISELEMNKRDSPVGWQSPNR